MGLVHGSHVVFGNPVPNARSYCCYAGYVEEFACFEVETRPNKKHVQIPLNNPRQRHRQSGAKASRSRQITIRKCRKKAGRNPIRT